MYIEFASQRNITRNQVVIHVNVSGMIISNHQYKRSEYMKVVQVSIKNTFQ